MKTMSVLLLLSTLLGVAASVSAAEIRIGAVNVERVLREAPQAVASSKQLENEFKPQQEALAKRQDELRAKQERYQRDGAIMSATEKSKFENDLEADIRAFRGAEARFRDDLNQRRNDELGKLQQEIAGVLEELAKKEKYNLIVGNGVLYADDVVDITGKLLDALRARAKK